jgi:hypothetical protein
VISVGPGITVPSVVTLVPFFLIHRGRLGVILVACPQMCDGQSVEVNLYDLFGMFFNKVYI